MKVLLTHGYFIEEDAKEQKIMRPYPPLGLLYVSAFLSQNNIENSVFDSTFSSREKLLAAIEEQKPDIIALYTNLMTKVNVLQIARAAKQIIPGTKIVMGGPDVTYNAENYLKHGADILVIGEGENTMLELVTKLSNDSAANLRDIQGLAFFDSNGALVKTESRTKLRELDELPLPARSAIDMSMYLQVWKKHHGQSALNVSTQRGCPYTCKWCSTSVYGQSYRRRLPKNVVEELRLIKKEYNPDTIWFVDDVFTVSHKWLAEFVEQLEENKVEISFECITRADRLNGDVISLLKKAGCFRVWIGAESGSQKIIDAMDRRVSVEKVREMIILAKKAGIETGTFIMLGYPGETEVDIEETIRHLKASNPDHFTITVAYPIKGTSLYQEIEPVITQQPDWRTSTDRDIDFRRTYSRRYYTYAVSRVVNEVNYYKRKERGRLGRSMLKFKIKAVVAKMRMQLEKLPLNNKMIF